MSTPAARQRAYRVRQDAGRMVLRIEVHDVDVPAALVVGGFLDKASTDDRHAVERAVERLLKQLSTE